MVAAAPENGHRGHGAALRQNRLAVFHSEDIVGCFQKICIQSHLFQCRLTGSGEGFSSFQLAFQQGPEFLTQQGLCGVHQPLGIGIFRAEAEIITETAQDPDTSCGEAFGRGKGVFHRKLQHQIGAAVQCGLCPQGFIDDGRGASLYKISAHQADNR